MLATLQGRGFVNRNPEGAYRLGLRVVQLAHATSTGVDLRRAAQPLLQRLSLVSEDTVNLAKWHDGQIIYVDVLPSSRPLRFVEMPGSIAPLHATALGKAIAAHLPEADALGLVREAGLVKFTPRTITTPQRLLEEIRRARRRGYALDAQEKDEGAACVAAPVFDAHGIVGAISLSAPASRMDAGHISAIVSPLREACAELSRLLGHRSGSHRRAHVRSGTRQASAAGRADLGQC
jgi:IclR family acetate operon transcriptional repressor